MSIGWAESYTGGLRKRIGHDPLIVPSVRAIIQDDKGRVLFLKGRKGWAMPAGSIELNESIYDTLKREVIEEVGIDVLSATVIAIYTSKPVMTNKFNDQYQMFEILFRVDKWSGVPFNEEAEYREGGFFDLENLPINPESNDYWSNHFREVFEDYKHFNGQLILK